MRCSNARPVSSSARSKPHRLVPMPTRYQLAKRCGISLGAALLRLWRAFCILSRAARNWLLWIILLRCITAVANDCANGPRKKRLQPDLTSADVSLALPSIDVTRLLRFASDPVDADKDIDVIISRQNCGLQGFLLFQPVDYHYFTDRCCCGNDRQSADKSRFHVHLISPIIRGRLGCCCAAAE